MSNHNNETFVFEGKAKIFTFALMGIGVLCLALSWFSGTEDMHHMRFWTNYLHNSVFFVGIAFAAVLFISTHTMAWGGWHTVFKRVPEAMMPFLYIGVILFAILAVAIMSGMAGTELLYLWNEPMYLDPSSEHFDPLAHHKSAFVNPTAYFLTAVVIAIWSIFAFMFRKLSIKQDESPYQVTEGKSVPEETRKTRIYAAAFLPIAGFSSAYCIWQWVMSVDTHWYSTLFAWYCTVSWWVAMVALVYMIILYLRSKGYLKHFTEEHTHDLGKYIFGFSVFWAYLWFSQFMLIWYSNNGEETQYFFLRFEQFKPLFFGNLLINFAAPFLILMMNTSKRTLGTLGFTAGLVFLGHWLDFFLMIKPGVWYNYEHKLHISHAGDHDHKDHSENTFKLNDKFNGGKAVLTDYQDPQDHGDDQHDDGHTDDGHTHDEHTHDDGTAHEHGHEGDHHADEHHDEAHGDAHGHADGGHGEGGGHDSHAHAPGFTIGVHLPGFIEIGTMLGFLGLFLFVTFSMLTRASLYPPNDPYIEESEHHDTGIGVVKEPH